MNNYRPVIGLEIHVELKTVSKMFCQCPADWFGKAPNSQTCPVCLGLPGALPVPNKKAIEWTILIAKALNCKINKRSKFDRKHYFYPDLPKGYQISQYDEPIAEEGQVIIAGPVSPSSQASYLKYPLRLGPPPGSTPAKLDERKTFRIRRVHLEEDTGKLIHKDGDTLIDFNRSGVPLVEIVTEPDFDNSDDVKRFLEELQTILRYLEVSDCDMEKGSMRLEPNISVGKRRTEDGGRKIKNELPKYKVEVKNINSFRFVKRAIDFEVERQIEILEKGETPEQETRGWDENRNLTFSQRTKEQSHDYRYFPEPDIPPLFFDDKFLSFIKVPALPKERLEKYIEKFGLKYEDAFILTRDKKVAEYFERVIGEIGETGEIGSRVASMIVNKRISTNLSLKDFVEEAKKKLSPKKTDEIELNRAVEKIILENKNAVESFKKGKENIIMFLVGQVMKEMKGQADAQIVKEKLLSVLSYKL